MLKSALINAQRMGENVIREANQKAEDILHRANLRGDDIIRDANELLQKPATAPTRSSARPTTKSWPKSVSMTAFVSRSPASSPMC